MNNFLSANMNIRLLFVVFITMSVVFVPSHAEDIFGNEDGVNITTTSTTNNTYNNNTNYNNTTDAPNNYVNTTYNSTNYNNTNDAPNNYVNTTNHTYAVRAYECDSNNTELVGMDKVEKIHGSMIRICFVPTNETMMDGIGIEQIDSFSWSHGNLVAEAVIDGTAGSGLHEITCRSSELCVLQSMLPAGFYQPGSIEGDGTVTLSDEARTRVPVKRDMFHTADANFGPGSGQCIADTNALHTSFPALEAATLKYQDMELQAPGPGSTMITASSGLFGTIEDVIVGAVIAISVPEIKEKSEYKKTCLDAGGRITQLPDTVLACSLYGRTTIMATTNSMSCLADTNECNQLDVPQTLREAYALAGISCVPAPPTAAPTKAPTVAPATRQPLLPFAPQVTPTTAPTAAATAATVAATNEMIDTSSSSGEQHSISISSSIGTTSIISCLWFLLF